MNAEPYLTPAEKLTTGKKNPSVLKSSNMPWTGCPLILKDILGAPKSRQQLTTSSEFSRCWLMEATALGIRPRQYRAETEREDGWLLRLQSHCECRAGWWARRGEGEQRGGEMGDECFKRDDMKWMRKGDGSFSRFGREGRWNRYYAFREGITEAAAFKGFKALKHQADSRLCKHKLLTSYFLIGRRRTDLHICNQLAWKCVKLEDVRHVYQSPQERSKVELVWWNFISLSVLWLCPSL